MWQRKEVPLRLLPSPLLLQARSYVTYKYQTLEEYAIIITNKIILLILAIGVSYLELYLKNKIDVIKQAREGIGFQ